MTTHLIPSRSLRKNFKLPLAFAFLNINTSTNTSTLYFRYLEVVPTFPSPRRPSRRYSEPPTIPELPIHSLHLRYLFAPGKFQPTLPAIRQKRRCHCPTVPDHSQCLYPSRQHVRRFELTHTHLHIYTSNTLPLQIPTDPSIPLDCLWSSQRQPYPPRLLRPEV